MGDQGAEGQHMETKAEGWGLRKTNTLFPVKLMQLKIVIKETVHSVSNTIEKNDSYNVTRV